jgi:uncharacterized delta-60 repeat protein
MRQEIVAINKAVAALILLGSLAIETNAQQAGDLDTSFSADGKLLIDFGPDFDDANALVIQPDGRIVVAGSSDVGPDFDFALVRCFPNGAIDSTFGSNGKTTTDFGSNNDYGQAMALQPDGKIVVAGVSGPASVTDNDFVVARYNADGSLDLTFDSDGWVATDFSTNDDYALSVALQADGKIVVAGRTEDSPDSDVAVARYNTDGTLDGGFGTGGKLTISFGTNYDWVSTIRVQSDGKIVVSGYTSAGTDSDFALARVNADGSLDGSFGTGGKVTTAMGPSHERIFSIAMQLDGKIVAAGFAFNGADYDFALARYNSNGSLDVSFDGDGKVVTDFLGIDERGRSVAIQADGRIVVAGYLGSGIDFALARYDPDGDLDLTFSSDGKATTDVGSGSAEQARAVAIQGDGAILAAGYTSGGNINQFALLRYLGGSALSDVTSPQTFSSVALWPNPADRNVILRYTVYSEECISIAITDMLGRVLSVSAENMTATAGKREHLINLSSDLVPGFYSIVLLSSGGAQASTVLVKH